MKKNKIILTAALFSVAITGAFASSTTVLEEYFYQTASGQFISYQSEVQCHVIDVPGCKINIPGVGLGIQLYKQTSPGAYHIVQFD